MTIVKTTKEVRWQNYQIKANQFYETARDANAKENWNAVGLNAVHAAISANDTMTVFLGQVRSVGDKHQDAVELLIKVLNDSDEVNRYSKHLMWLINRKNLVEYESRLFFAKEANEALKHAERFVGWVNDRLSK